MTAVITVFTPASADVLLTLHVCILASIQQPACVRDTLPHKAVHCGTAPTRVQVQPLILLNHVQQTQDAHVTALLAVEQPRVQRAHHCP